MGGKNLQHYRAGHKAWLNLQNSGFDANFHFTRIIPKQLNASYSSLGQPGNHLVSRSHNRNQTLYLQHDTSPPCRTGLKTYTRRSYDVCALCFLFDGRSGLQWADAWQSTKLCWGTFGMVLGLGLGCSLRFMWFVTTLCVEMRIVRVNARVGFRLSVRVNQDPDFNWMLECLNRTISLMSINQLLNNMGYVAI